MKRPAKEVFMAAALLITAVILAGFSVGENLTVMGIVTEHYQIQSDDEGIFTLGNGEQDAALAGAVGKRVVVIGSVAEYEGRKTISVISYQFLE